MTDAEDAEDEARAWRDHADDYARLLLELAGVYPHQPCTDPATEHTSRRPASGARRVSRADCKRR